jgi:hypothetical protein
LKQAVRRSDPKWAAARELRFEEASVEVAALGQCPARPVAMRRIEDEGDEANGAALWH